MSRDDGVLNGGNAVAFYAVQKFTARARGLGGGNWKPETSAIASHTSRRECPRVQLCAEGTREGGAFIGGNNSRRAARAALFIG